MSMKLHTPDGRDMMEVVSLRREGDVLVVRGVVMGTLPTRVVLHPDQLRAAWSLLSVRLVWDLLVLMCRSGRRSPQR